MLQDMDKIMVGQVRQILTKQSYENLYEAQYFYWTHVKALMLNNDDGYAVVKLHYPHVTRKMALAVANASNEKIKIMCHSSICLLQPSISEDLLEQMLSTENSKTLNDLQNKALMQALAKKPVADNAADMVHAIGGGGY